MNVNTENGISAAEACHMHALAPEDFTQICNEDGSLKSQPKTTTFSLRDDSTKTITIDNNVLYISSALLIVTLVGLVVMFVRNRKKKS